MIKNRTTVPFFILGLFIFLLLIIFLISCSTTGKRSHFQQNSSNILNDKHVKDLEDILKDSLLSRPSLWLLKMYMESLEVEMRSNTSYDLAKEKDINQVEESINQHDKEIQHFQKIIENTEIFLKNNSDDALSIKLASFRERLQKYEYIIKEYEERFKLPQYQFKLLEDQYLADTRKKDALRKSYKEHILKGIDDIGINSEYVFYNESSIGIIESLFYFKKKIYLTVKLIILPYSNAHIEHFHLYDKFAGHLGSPEDESFSNLYDSRDEKEPQVRIYKRVFSAENIPNNGELKIILQGWNINHEKTLKYAELDYGKTIPISNNIKDFSKKDIKEKDFVSEITKIQGKRKGNHLLIPVWLDIHGVEIDAELLLDTGASITTIPYNLYKTGNPINLNSLKKEKFQTADGIVIAPTDKLKLRTSAYTKEIEVALIDNDVLLLGANYFEGNVYTVDLTNECIYIHPKYSHK